jgi:metal-responsive CopG/Arc/MetJ family transcriptional regulator
MADPPEEKQQMIHMRVEHALLKRLDDFRFRYRFESRSEVARWLMKAALDAKLRPDQKPKPEGE